MKALSFLPLFKQAVVLYVIFSAAAFAEETENDWHTPTHFRCPAWAEKAPIDKPLKVITYNVQFMTGGVYNFWDGPDTVSPLDIESQHKIAAEIAEAIRKENPDIALLQEVDRDERTGQDQIELLMEKLGEIYPCYAATAYSRLNKEVFLPANKRPSEQHLLTLSRYRISDTVRFDLPRIPRNYIKYLHYRRAVLETRIPLSNGDSLFVLNLHLDAFAQGTDTMQKQVSLVSGLFEKMTQENKLWIAGGDFNLLPPGQYEHICAQGQNWYQPESELKKLTDQYSAIPSVEDATGADRSNWFTQILIKECGLDQTLDYMFYSPAVSLIKGRVWSKEVMDLSDHMPVIGEFELQR
ncbi:endonuclease/exonuclease/phosphatase family protein [Sansalvadorimonas sp. 2012CJ34-2]|uniref:Endonuclease/exonuclease/phosphatase family protein n=1 Tax=Parendozoicomonas callyspongiae TaxID=2942213 RepID=A0ABT0PAW8_9GAMM|nr:endonuclease/exonuclease/phosphatase family protein [Sansalvadorimonas sp. 2012CJ34-2]MCL6268532.1 endonuclease/exonuclease/phosphatase family protein [Sansalvadorimonas sp. 2012CJ34-2]